MSYGMPPLVVHIRPTTNAAANTSNVGVALLAAPGAGMALRIRGFAVSAGREVVAANNVEIIIIDGAGTSWWSCMVSGGDGYANIEYNYPGIQIPTNRSLTMTNISNVASMTYRITAYYYIDDVT